MIDNQSKLNLVIGFPLGHSKSPLLHNFVYGKLGISAVMLALPKRNIRQLVPIIKNFPVGLTCVTMPFKQAVMPYLDFIDKRAKDIGAVNTVINKNGKLYGFNTDIDGVAFALRGLAIKNKIVLILGAGGAARAVVYYVSKQGGKILYLNRTKKNAIALQKKFGGKVISEADLSGHQADIVINTTPVGMYPNLLESPLNKKYFKKGQTVFDVIYNNKPTRLLKEAKAAGSKTVSGMDMFVGQGLRQIELYSGKKLNKDIIRVVCRFIGDQGRY